MSADLFAPFTLGDLTLANRMVMAPMTRNRADANGVASPMMETYYGRRASAGLIISESIPRSPTRRSAIRLRRQSTPMLRPPAGFA